MTTRRQKSKFPGIDKSVTLRVRQELLDQDYIHLLSEEEKTWLSNFMREYASADFNHPGKKLHKTKKRIKSVYDSNNARNRDAFAVTKSNGMLKNMTGASLGKEDPSKGRTQDRVLGMAGSKSTLPNETEDVLIAVLDFINENNKS